MAIKEEEDLEEDTRGQRTLRNIKIDNITSAINNFAYAWKCENDSSLKRVEKIDLRRRSNLDFAGFEPNDFHQTLLRAGERSQRRRS